MKIAFTAGDPAGLGLSLMIRHAQQPAPYDRVLFAHPDLVQHKAQALNLPITLTPWDQKKNQSPAQHITLVPLTETFTPHISPDNTGHTIASISQATQFCLEKKCHSLITLPVNKALINESGLRFTGHTEFIAQQCDAPKPVMMMTGKHFKIVTLSTHIPISDIPTHINTNNLKNTLHIIEQALQHTFHIPKPCIAILGLNPHAGEKGHIGQEEQTIITPLINTLNQQNKHIEGPYPADGYFMQTHPQHDCILAMYHDQALIPFKQKHGLEGSNMTLGLPIIRLSVDHGTAYQLNPKIASIKSLQYTTELATQILRHP